MLHYFAGRTVQIGDAEDFDGEPATVIEMIGSNEQLATPGMDRLINRLAIGTGTASYWLPTH